ncbi:MAG: BtpA/SgcQ family protein [Crenarchaeota archaeon]|nr:BtpA/SgcQ family protein [Thermoproteota archaeon]
MARTPTLSFKSKPVIGVVHLPPLPGSPRGGNIDGLTGYAVNEAAKLVDKGVDAVIIENYGDKPFTIRVKNPATLAAMAIIVHEVAKSLNYRVPVGVSLLRNSGPEAIAIAYTSGASFVRINAYCEPRVAPEGLLEPVMREVEEMKHRLGADTIQVLADIDCKHSKPLTPGYDPREAARECIERGSPTAIIVTGPRTGEPPHPGYVAAITRAVDIPIIVGSGVNPENIRIYWPIASGFIVGTYFKTDGKTTNPVDPKRVESLMSIVHTLRSTEKRSQQSKH